jgi:hypothetical protein
MRCAVQYTPVCEECDHIFCCCKLTLINNGEESQRKMIIFDAFFFYRIVLVKKVERQSKFVQNIDFKKCRQVSYCKEIRRKLFFQA